MKINIFFLGIIIFFLNCSKIIAEEVIFNAEKINIEDNENVKVNLLKPEYGISPGQACVFYKKDQFGHKVLGGGWIKD